MQNRTLAKYKYGSLDKQIQFKTLPKPSYAKLIFETRRFGPLRGPPSSSCGWLVA